MREGWEYKRIKDCFSLVNEMAFGDEVKIGLENIESETGRLLNSDSFFEGKGILFKPNDILFGKLRPYLAKVLLSDFTGQAVGDFYVLRPERNTYPYFGARLLLSDFFIKTVNDSTFGAKMPRAKWSFISNIGIALPPLPEQIAIAAYLDKKTAHIASVISLLEKKRATYLRLKKSLIHKVVTKGLNPDVELKDSGIEWLGQIPKHWEVKRVKDIGFMYSGLSGKSGEDFRNEDGAKNKCFIPYTNILNNSYLNTSFVKPVLMLDGEKQNKVKKGDLFFLMSSEDYESIGKTSVLNEDVDELYLNSFCKGVRLTNKSAYPLFVNYQLLSDAFRDGLRFEARGFTRINLKIDKVMGMTVCLPPLSEQQQIAAYLDRQSERIDAMVSNINAQIERFKALRKSLINEVVTGERSIV